MSDVTYLYTAALQSKSKPGKLKKYCLPCRRNTQKY